MADLLETLSSIGKPALWLVDVVVVTFIIYRVYVLLSRTRAMQLLIGFLLIVLVDVASKRLGLETLSWLITNVSSYLVFGLIVLLQPELRRLVSEIGRMPIFQWLNPLPEIPMEEIVAAARNMASAKTGSIMVILREIKPPGILESAVKIDSAITRELLETIFHKDTPLHDGAVLIEGAKIVAASAYLPLSVSRSLKKTHGARHRAALGMSEETDAIVVVTSEETGKVSVMVNGEISNLSRSQELGPLLVGLFEENKTKQSSYMQFLDRIRPKAQDEGSSQ